MATEPHSSAADSEPVFCARCARQLRPGAGDCWQITIDAVADPFPPILDSAESADQLRERMGQMITELRDVSEREAMDQVHRRLILLLCNPCYRQWIDNPTP